MKTWDYSNIITVYTFISNAFVSKYSKSENHRTISHNKDDIYSINQKCLLLSHKCTSRNTEREIRCYMGLFELYSVYHLYVFFLPLRINNTDASLFEKQLISDRSEWNILRKKLLHCYLEHVMWIFLHMYTLIRKRFIGNPKEKKLKHMFDF